MELLNVEKLDEAREKLYEKCIESGFTLKVEKVSVSDSLDKILADDVVAEIDVPTFRRSTVDGYAVRSIDVGGASDSVPSFLKVIGESKMGNFCEYKICAGETVYVPTGGMLPEGSDAMVMVEWVENFGFDKIAVYKSVASGESLVNIGDDNKKSDILLKKGRKIKISDIGLLSSNGIRDVNVYKGFDISIVSTGDEIASIDREKNIAEVYDINSYTIEAMCKKKNFNIKEKILLKDEKENLKNKISSLMGISDVVVISGGSSKGKKDATAEVIGELCSSGVMTHGIAVKPGKPTIIGYDEKTETIVIGLPGHPVASVLLFDLIVNYLYEKFSGDISKKIKVKGKMCENIMQSPGRKTFQLVTIDDNYDVRLVLGKSGLINTMSKADGYIIIDEDSEGVNVGEIVDVFLL